MKSKLGQADKTNIKGDLEWKKKTLFFGFAE